MTDLLVPGRPRAIVPADGGLVAAPAVDARTAAGRVTVSGKFFECDGRKWFLKGLTYGPFLASEPDVHLPHRDQVRDDFRQIRALGANCVRVYHRPPVWALDAAMDEGLHVFVDVPWEKHRCFFEDWSAQQAARDEVRRTGGIL